MVHLSNLCTEILEVTTDAETAVCNLGSINLGRAPGRRPDGRPQVDWDRLRDTVRTAVPFLDRVIDINYYPSEPGRGVQPALAAGRPRRDGPAGRVLRAAAAVRLGRRRRELSTRIAEEIYLTALETSADLAERARRRTRPSRRPARPRGSCSPTCGA